MPDGRPYPSAGWVVCNWIQQNLVHGEGDALGEPVRLEVFQRYIIERIYQYDPATGQLLHNRVLIGIPKGNAKTEIASHIGLAELLGPLAPKSPNIPLSAASWEQANRLFGAARYAILGDGEEKLGPLAPFFVEGEHILEDRILHPEAVGRMYRTAAVAGTNDGGLPTCVLADELHEWEGERRERQWTVHGKSVKKRGAPRHLPPAVAEALGLEWLYGTMQIGITTAGDSIDSLLGRLFNHGLRVASGETEDPRFLFLWWQMRIRSTRPTDELAEGEAEVSEELGWDLEDPEQRVQAVLEANPAAGSFLPVAGLEDSYLDPTVPRHEYLRYNGNLFVSSPKAWMTDLQIAARRKDPRLVTELPPQGTPIVVGFDGSNNRDSTAMVGWTIDGDYGFVLGHWEPIDGEPVPRIEVDAKVHWSFGYFDVWEFAGDPPGWRSELEAWEAEFGERTMDDAHDRVLGSGKVLRFETYMPSRMGPACAHLRAAFLEGGPTIDGDPALLRHLRNCRVKGTRYGDVIVKEHKDSTEHIDLGVAAVIARERAQWWAAHRTPRKPRYGGF